MEIITYSSVTLNDLQSDITGVKYYGLKAGNTSLFDPELYISLYIYTVQLWYCRTDIRLHTFDLWGMTGESQSNFNSFANTFKQE